MKNIISVILVLIFGFACVSNISAQEFSKYNENSSSIIQNQKKTGFYAIKKTTLESHESVSLNVLEDKPAISIEDYKYAIISKDNMENFTIEITLNNQGKLKMKKFLQDNLNKQIAFVMNNKIITIPYVRGVSNVDKISITMPSIDDFKSINNKSY